MDDNPLLRVGITEVLSLAGFEVHTEPDGVEGLKAIACGLQPDLILCDIAMPRLDGFGVLRQLRTDPRTSAIPFLFLTGKTDPSYRQLAAELGVWDCLYKPVTAQELLAAVRGQLERVPPCPAPAALHSATPSPPSSPG